MSFDKNDFTWGYEIEWGDVDRRLEIPEHLGSWEYSETDIVNLNPPYQYVACDPRGESPPFGGEINTKPTSTWQEQADRVMELHDLFVAHGDTPTASVVNHGHLHVFVPGLKDDIASLKKLIAYVAENQEDTVETCYGFYDHLEMKSTKGAKMYLKYDGGRQKTESQWVVRFVTRSIPIV